MQDSARILKAACTARELSDTRTLSVSHTHTHIHIHIYIYTYRIPLAPSKLRALLVSYRTGDRVGFVPCVDWRRVMYSLANLPEPTVEQLKKLLAAAKGKGGSVEAMPRAAAAAVEMWFEKV